MKRTRWGLAGCTTVLLSGALAVGAISALGTSKVIGHGVRLKGTNLWYAQGRAVSAKAISASLVPVPRQPVKVQWSVVCQRPNKTDPAIPLATNESSGQASVRATATVKLTLPYRQPPTCVVTLYATLQRNGSLIVQLRQT